MSYPVETYITSAAGDEYRVTGNITPSTFAGSFQQPRDPDEVEDVEVFHSGHRDALDDAALAALGFTDDLLTEKLWGAFQVDSDEGPDND